MNDQEQKPPRRPPGPPDWIEGPQIPTPEQLERWRKIQKQLQGQEEDEEDQKATRLERAAPLPSSFFRQVRRPWRQPPPEQLACEQELERLLKSFIRLLSVSQGKLVEPSQKERDELTQKIVPLFEQAEALGRQFAAKQLQRGLLPKLVGNLLDRAANFVGRAIDWSGQLTVSKVEALGESPSANDIQGVLDETAMTVAETLAPTEIQDIIEQTVLGELKSNDVEYVQWIDSPDSCKVCQENAGQGPIPIGETFASGHTAPPAHGRCKCHLQSM